jgi:hypothetical protein
MVVHPQEEITRVIGAVDDTMMKIVPSTMIVTHHLIITKINRNIDIVDKTMKDLVLFQVQSVTMMVVTIAIINM